MFGVRRGRHVRADEEPRMRRLVVGRVLPGDRHAVLRIVQQRVDPVAGHIRRGVDTQRGVVGRPPDDFLAPVAKQVAAQRRIRLGAVVRRGAIRGQQARVAARAVLVDVVAVDQLAHRVGVPPGEMVRRARIAADVGARGIAQEGHVGTRAPEFRAGIAGPDVGGHAAARAFRAIVVGSGENPRAVRRVAKVGSRLIAGFVDIPDLEARARRDEVAHVQRIAMTQSGGVHRGAVVIDGGGAKDDLVTSILVDVGDRQVVITLPVIGGVVVAVEHPALCELAVAPVPGGDHRTRVVAAREDGAGPLAVEIRDAREETIDAIAVGIAP